MMEALKVENIIKDFKTKKKTIRAVNNVSFTVHEGETFGLLGMNGAGKSTLINIITNLINADQGSVYIFDNSLKDDLAKCKSLMNVSPQETSVAPLLSVKENLEFIARIYGYSKEESRARALDIMKQMDLTNRANDKAGKLSGGLMRRLSIGMALISNPKLLFLDEPTLGVDIVARRELWHLMKELKKSGVSIILTTHYLEEAESLCDRIGIMSEGYLIAIGSSKELIELSKENSFENAFLKLTGKDMYIDEK